MARACRLAKNSRYVSIIKRQCRFCSYIANIKGIASHERLCMQQRLDEIRSDAIRKTKELEDQLSGLGLPSLSDSQINVSRGVISRSLNEPHVPDDDPASESEVDISHDDPQSGVEPQHDFEPPDAPVDAPSDHIRRAEMLKDAIKVECHPSAGIPPEVVSFLDYNHRISIDDSPPTDKEPWLPFSTRADYEYANISLAAGLSEDLNEKLISLIHRIARGDARFTLNSSKQLKKTWEDVSLKLPAFEEKIISVPYLKESRSFTLHFRPIWKWALKILKDPRLVSRFNWDARKLFKFNTESKSFERYYDEPWTGDRFWDVQSHIPEIGKPFGFIIYADKNKLSTFGTQKGYPVIVRCANLPHNIRNGEGIGGGVMVGWLPIVPENAGDSNKVSFTNFKNEVWHRCVSAILESIATISKAGCWVDCGDGVTRQVFPCILIASADYEEQSVMALNRGVKSLKPCNTCEVPSIRLSNLCKKYRDRTAKGTKMRVILSQLAGTKKVREQRLKSRGLRPVYNAFWDIQNSDIHRALSFDRLHTLHSGIFAGHIWKLFKDIVDKLGRHYGKEIDKGFCLFPIWREMYHFENVMHITFNDGKKHEDMAKQLLYVLQSVFDRDENSKAYILLRLLRSFLILDMYISFDRQTVTTIAEGRKELKNFNSILKKYILIDQGPDAKNWNFPKLHQLLHAFQDIIDKGVSRNYNTKPNEKLHGPLRDIYHERTNFRNIAPQITKIDHQILVSKYINAQIEVLDKSSSSNQELDEDKDDGIIEEGLNRSLLLLPPDDKFHLGSRQKPISILQIEVEHKDDLAFRDFRKRLAKFLNIFLPAFGIPLPGNKYLKLNADHTIVEFRYLKVHYESKVTWQVVTDYLHCTPKFYGKPRHDSVLVKTVNGHIFGHLVFLFAIWIGGKPYPIALIQGLDAYLGPPRLKDKELEILRLGLKSRSQVEFVSVSSIERGALIMQEFAVGKENEHIVVDTVDGDMFLQLREMQKRR